MLKRKKIVFVILGATGDLSVGKIFPALYSLWQKKMAGANFQNSLSKRKAQTVENLPRPSFSFVGVSRRPWSDDNFRDFLGREKYDSGFLDSVHYKTVFFDSCDGAPELKVFLKSFGNAEFIFYVSMAPALYNTALTCMKKNRLMSVGDSKILIEKPFGLNLASAKKLNTLALSFLEHKQIYRVDHYLGKSALQALMKIHEKGDTLSKIINIRNVASIHVGIFETVGIKGRGDSYDFVGAFRDVGQNHILQMLSVVAMTPPRATAPTSWHSARAKVVESLDFSKKISINIGQYDGYKDEEKIPKSSKTETFFSIKTHFTKGKLKGVPVLLESGKKMLEQKAFVNVQFKNGETLNVSVGGEAYEHILEYAVADKREFFAGSKEIFAAWKFTDTIVKKFSKTRLKIYKEGEF